MDAPRFETEYSWQDYLNWPGDERFELIHGTPYAMSPAPRRRHQEVSGEIFRQAANALRGGPCRVFTAPFDVKLSPDEQDHAPTVVQPDVVVVCDAEKLTEQGMTGPPDLVVEVISSDSGIADRRRKFAVYEHFGVREYWLVDPEEELVEVYLRERADSKASAGAFRRSGVYAVNERLEAGAVGGLTVDLGEVFRAPS